MLKANLALEKLISSDAQLILDIGSGTGEHAQLMSDAGKTVVTNNLYEPADVVGDFNQIGFVNSQFDAIWCSHVLEHQPNVNKFLRKCKDVLKDDGILAITVPPRKDGIVGGHLTLWNAGLLLYNLIAAGFDCSGASVKTYGYNISVVVRKKAVPIEVYDKLNMDKGDIEMLAPYFPIPAKQGFNGNIDEVNW